MYDIKGVNNKILNEKGNRLDLIGGTWVFLSNLEYTKISKVREKKNQLTSISIISTDLFRSK